MEPVVDLRIGRGLRGAHVCDLIVRKAIGLEVGQAPVGVAKAGPNCGRRPIGLDRLLPPTERFQGVRNRQMELGRLRCLDEEFAIELDGSLVVTEADPGGRPRCPVGAIAGLNL